MAAEIITKEDLVEFEDRLLDKIKKMMAQSTDQPRKWLRSAQVRKMLNISPNTLTSLRVNGIIKFTRLGGIMYYNNDDINQMLAGNQ
ncbi:helix-turn-helix domain-containing protein [Mucilaginibacter aquariorum]|uniref:Helix-turn-helix domain-containing protein n=1 Tax=Mucilaginibacter aquariorum TaxID=2967225 RepID=A0ABT1SYK1_9SPHI|nr:helix-turn-helix domain-containing protein [Mucilaginibacter aquariorum]MCQ6957337.1 helix-turn-helix domain-containing protein [Mucilaginibacter aquariorum]